MFAKFKKDGKGAEGVLASPPPQTPGGSVDAGKLQAENARLRDMVRPIHEHSSRRMSTKSCSICSVRTAPADFSILGRCPLAVSAHARERTTQLARESINLGGV